MHTIYPFLMTEEDALQHDFGGTDSEKQKYVSYWENQYQGRLDDNNWEKPLAVVCMGGTVYTWIEGEDLPDLLRKKGKGNLWTGALRFSLECVATDFLPPFIADPEKRKDWEPDLPTKSTSIDRLSTEELIRVIQKEVPETLARMYQRLIGVKGNIKGKRPINCILKKHREHYRRRKLTKMFECFMHCNEIPFTTYYANPYEYSAFDVREAEDKDLAILFMDIHT